MRVRILYTNGNKSFDLFWVTHNGTDVYYGHPGENAHFSYHASGKRHFSKEQKKEQEGWEVPLKDINPHRHLITKGFINSKLAFNGENDYFEYTGKKSDGVLIIDQRTIPEGYIVNAMIGLIQPQGMGMIGAIGMFGTTGQITQKTFQILLCTEYLPWVYCVLSAGPNQLK